MTPPPVPVGGLTISRGRFRAGFSLAEVLITTAGMLVLGAALLVVYRTTFNTFAVVTATSWVTGELRNAVEQIQRDVRRAQKPRITTQCGTYIPSSTLLLLHIKDMAGSGNDRRVVYRCEPNSGACTEASPGNLERRVVEPAACGDLSPVETHALAHRVAGVSFADGTSFNTTLIVNSSKVSPYLIQGKLIVRYTMRNPPPT